MPSLYPGYRSYQQDDEGPVRLNPRLIKKLCVKHKGYSTPSLNEVLYLHYLGISKIESLEEYVNLKVLWLEGNGLTKIENIDHLQNLVCLYLQENCIEKIEGLEAIKELNQLNLANNFITEIPQCILSNEKLESLNLANNKLSSPSSISLAGLENHPSITSLDLSNNELSNDEDLLRILGSLPNLKVLKLEGNPVLKALPQYRRKVISSIKSLVYLDSRPVFEDERRAVNAWERGGLEEERIERIKIEEEAKAKRAREFISMKAFMEGCSREECVKRGLEEEERVLKTFEEKRKIEEGKQGYDDVDLDSPDYDETFVTKQSQDSVEDGKEDSRGTNVNDENEGTSGKASKIEYHDGDLFNIIE